MSLTHQLKRLAHESGFELAGACPAVTPEGISHLYKWLDSGFSGQMDYIADRLDAYAHPRGVLPEVRSLLMLGMNYASGDQVIEDRDTAAAGSGLVSNYAWGDGDYHDLIHKRLKRIVRWLNDAAPGSRSRGVVDTAPLLERDFARLSGLGWVGKNTMLINREIGSYFFIAAILTDVELDYDDRFEADHCGSCTACLDQCPTDAFPHPYVLDATRCISYLTIEHRDSIDPDLRPGIGNWLFGCDVCQQVCPWNRKSEATAEPMFHPLSDMRPVDLCELFELDDEAFRARFRKTPLWRAKRPLILRNAAIVLGNQRCQTAIPVLKRFRDASFDRPERETAERDGAEREYLEIAREACNWALQAIERG